MTSSEFRQRLSARAATAGVSITADAQVQFEVYFRLLAKWNTKINLTALTLRRPTDEATDEAFDRLFIEPMAAAQYIPESAIGWFDIGSGGGSPAIPIRIMRPLAKLTMIESKARKAAFLREVIRALDFPDVCVENRRFEDVVTRIRPHSLDLVSVRAVKTDSTLFTAIYGILAPNGRAFLFHSPVTTVKIPPMFVMAETVRFRTNSDARLSIIKPLFHVEQSD